MQKNKYRVKAATPEQKNAQEETVYFRLKKPIEQEEPQYQLIVNRNGRKIHHHNEENSVQSDRFKDQIKTNELAKMFGGMSLKKSAQYFLKRVDDIEIKYKNKGQQFLNNNLLPRSQKLAEQRHKQMRQNLFAKSRGIKIIDLNQPQSSSNFVEIGNNKIEVQNLGPMNQYYYILQKRKTIKQGPSISLPEESIYLLDSMQFEENGPDDDRISDEDEDSNRSSNPDYDYPEQEYHQGDSDDQGVIDRDYYTRNSDEEGYDSEPDQLDEEELYRRYLKRCKEDKDSSDGEYF